MSLTHEGERVSEALIRSMEHHTRFSHEYTAVVHQYEYGPLNIAISRETGSKGAAIARAVGARLDWKVYDHELLEVMARDLHVRVKLLENVDERHVSWLQEAVETFCKVGSIREGTYVRHLVETMLSLAGNGHCVMVGRGAAFVLPAASTLRVRLMAPLEDRIVNVAHERNLSRHDAARYIAGVDRERLQFVRQHFMHDPSDSGHYDLVLNTARFPIEECAELIVDAAHTKEHAAHSM
jgi:cytidylate kinase